MPRFFPQLMISSHAVNYYPHPQAEGHDVPQHAYYWYPKYYGPDSRVVDDGRPHKKARYYYRHRKPVDYVT